MATHPTPEEYEAIVKTQVGFGVAKLEKDLTVEDYKATVNTIQGLGQRAAHSRLQSQLEAIVRDTARVVAMDAEIEKWIAKGKDPKQILVTDGMVGLLKG